MTPNELTSLMTHIIEKVKQFNTEITKIPIANQPSCLSSSRSLWALTALKEEVQEFDTANQQNNVPEAADALIDLIYFAVGRLLEMGIPIQSVFDDVQSANMQKIQGDLVKRPGGLGYDAIKPSNWQPPNHEWLVSIPSIIKDALRIQSQKSQDYNTGIDRNTQYYPFGDTSYYQMIHTKCMRLQSLIRNQQLGNLPNFESIHDTLIDLINYIIFYATFLESKK